MKTICHLSSVHPHTDTRIFLKECRSLAKGNYEVSYLVPTLCQELVEGVKIVGVAPPKNRIERIFVTTYRMAKIAIELDFDLYHIHDSELIPLGLWLRILGKRVVYDVHEDLPRQLLTKDWLPRPLRMILFKPLEYLENKAAARFSAVVGATPFITDRFAKCNKQTVNINNYPWLEELLPAVSENSPEVKKFVCYVGGITKIRGIYEMVKALDTSSVQLLLGGNYDSTVDLNELKKISGWEKVIELGYVNREKYREVLSRSQAGLVLFHPAPNHINAQPNKLFEYMSAGIPVVASNFPLWKKIVEDCNCGICVDPMNPQEISSAINWLYNNPNAAVQMGKNGREAVERMFNWETESQKLLQLYEQL